MAPSSASSSSSSSAFASASASALHLRIAIIGAGAAGIAQAKQIVDAFHLDTRTEDDVRVDVVVFEARDRVGGVWNQDPVPPAQIIRPSSSSSRTSSQPADKIYAMSSQPGVRPSPIYPGLRTNLPKDLMTYRSLRFPPSVPLFPHADQVRDYLSSCATAWNVDRFVRFRTLVKRVRLAHGGAGKRMRRWEVTSQRVDDDEMTVEEFDHVAVCNGHYEKASLPEIPGLGTFTGRIVHSRWYRRPEEYTGQRVLVVGAFASGSDIARELATLNLDRPCSSRVEEEGVGMGTEAVVSLLTPADSRSTSPPPSAPSSPACPTSTHLTAKQPTPSPTPRPRTHVHLSSSGPTAQFPAHDDNPWRAFVDWRGWIDRIERPCDDDGAGGDTTRTSVIVFKDGSTLTDVDTIIFATGYSYHFPFFKACDAPWSDKRSRVADGVVGEEESVDKDEIGGLEGLGLNNLDELMLFLRGDRSLALLGLVYQVVPFPLFEIQAHLVALLWAGRLPSFPEHPTLPARNAPLQISPRTPPNEDGAVEQTPKATPRRFTELVRGSLVLGFPYEFTYCDYLLELCSKADGGEAGGWGKVEDWRWELRKDTGLRRRTLGY